MSHLSLRSQPKSVTVFYTSFWLSLWHSSPASGPTIIWALLVLSSGNWREIVVKNFLSLFNIFVYFWSLTRKFKNRLVHAMNGNPVSGEQSTNKSKRKSKSVSWFGNNLITGFCLTLSSLWIAMLISLTKFFCFLDFRSRVFFSGFCIEFSHPVLFFWALIAFKDLW